jgi:hypothetical protein
MAAAPPVQGGGLEVGSGGPRAHGGAVEVGAASPAAVLGGSGRRAAAGQQLLFYCVAEKIAC